MPSEKAISSSLTPLFSAAIRPGAEAPLLPVSARFAGSSSDFPNINPGETAAVGGGDGPGGGGGAAGGCPSDDGATGGIGCPCCCECSC